jgi:hypothetical protein
LTVRWTVDIDDDLKAEIDRLRKERGVSMKVIVNEAMRLGLDEVEKEQKAQQALRRSGK